MAHLKALETRKDESLRKKWKTELTKRLYEKGYSKKNIINLFSFIDWVLILPEKLDKIFFNELTEYEKEKTMPYVTSVERLGEKRGMLEGMLKGKLETLHGITKKMLKEGYSVKKISELTSLSTKEINELKKQL